MMKKLCFAICILISLNTFAQQREDRRRLITEQAGMDMTPEESAILSAKRLTLDLNLDQKQQQQLETIYTRRAEEREMMRGEMRDPELESKLQMRSFEAVNERLDKEIAFQQAVMQVLDKDQYKRWKMTQNSERYDPRVPENPQENTLRWRQGQGQAY